MGQESAQPQRRRHFARHLLPQLALDDQQIHADGKVVDTQSARQLTALARL